MKKIIVKTVFENVDQEFLAWYIKHLRSDPDLIDVANSLELGEDAVSASKAPHTSAFAITTYEIR